MLAYYFYQPASGDESFIDSIAILPFTTTSEDPATAALAEGIPGSISASLLRLEKLMLVKPASVLQRYKGRDIDPKVVAEEQGVGAVLIGNVQRLEDTVAVNVELIDGRDNKLIWGQPYSRKISDIFSIQEDTARQVVEALRIQLSEDESGPLVQSGTENPEAYQAYLQGQYQMTRFSTEGWNAVKDAISHYERAIDLDPKYQEVYGRLAGLYAYMGSRELDPNGYEKARAYADKILEIDDSTVLAHQVKAQLHWRLNRDWEAAEKEYRQAAELDPSFEIDGSFLEWMGLREERLGQLERRLEQADPLSVNQQGSLGWSFLFVGEYDRTINQARKVLALEPEATDPQAMLSIAYRLKGMEEEAFEISLRGKSEEEAEALRAEFEESGIQPLYRRQLERIVKEPSTRPIALVQAYLNVGEKEKALEWLEKTWSRPLEGNEHSPSNPELDPLRGEPRFEQLLRKQNLPEEVIQKHLALR